MKESIKGFEVCKNVVEEFIEEKKCPFCDRDILEGQDVCFIDVDVRGGKELSHSECIDRYKEW